MILTGFGGSPAGADTQLQFNNGGVFGASANLTWDGWTLEAPSLTLTTVPDITPVLTYTPDVSDPKGYGYWVQAVFADGSHTGLDGYVNPMDGPTTLSPAATIQLTWGAVPGATGYEVWTDWRADDTTGLGLLATVGAGTLTWTDDGSVMGDDDYSGTLIYNTTGLAVTGMVTTGIVNVPSGEIFGPIRYHADWSTGDFMTSFAARYLDTVGLSLAFPFLFSITDQGHSSIATAVTSIHSSIAGDITGYWTSLQINVSVSSDMTGSLGIFGVYNNPVLLAPGAIVPAAYGFYAEAPVNSGGTLGPVYGFYGANLATGTAGTNPYFLWYNGTGTSAGVWRVNHLGIVAYYNPTFAAYTPGATDHERIVTQWNTNVAEIGTEAGGTGTLRHLRLLGAGYKLASLTSNGFVQTSGGDGTLSIGTLGSNVGTFLGTPSSANLLAAITDETGTGALVFATSPTLTTPSIAKLANLTSNGFVKTGSGDGTLSVVSLVETIGFTLGDGSAAITTGTKVAIQIPYACTITAARVLADQSGSIVVDLWVDTYANYPPTDADSITASAPPTLSTAIKSEDTTLTGWDVTLAAGEIMLANVDSVTTVTRATVQLMVTRI